MFHLRFFRVTSVLNFFQRKKELVRTLDVEKGCNFFHKSMYINSSDCHATIVKHKSSKYSWRTEFNKCLEIRSEEL